MVCSSKASCGGGYEGGGVSVRSDIQACFGRCTIKAKYDSFSSEIENKIKWYLSYYIIGSVITFSKDIFNTRPIT